VVVVRVLHLEQEQQVQQILVVAEAAEMLEDPQTVVMVVRV
jgi:hypothetical protein